MVHPGMMGVTELMTDETFLLWMENQNEDLLGSIPIFEIYQLFCRDAKRPHLFIP